MGIQRKQTLIHWNYFLALEEDLERLSRFVDFASNDETYSIEIARLFLSACAEVDVILKQLSASLNSDSIASNINLYHLEVTRNIPDFIEFEVLIPRFGLTLHPWEDWKENNSPFWWQHHNKVKHHRHDHFEKANLKNCLNAMGALYVSVLYLYKQQAQAGELFQYPRLFNVSDRHYGGTKMGRYGYGIAYKL